MRKSQLAACLMLLAVIGFYTCVLAQQACAEEHRMIGLKKTEPRLVATIKHQGPFDDIPSVTEKLVTEVKKGNHLIAGPTMIVYYNSPQNVPASELLWEVWVPVVEPGKIGRAGNDETTFKVLESTFVAYTYHIGPYQKVGDTYAELFEWIEKNKYPMAGYPVEVYWSDPEDTPEAKLVTEVWLPVKDRESPGIVR